ncbi:hypothetical protein J3R83DRAFT_7559 [Lanmaoa asiatica]|nr:hypothetical protein J3R83DRAFT_7559 [Lanmaoa asiatica]
MTPVETFVDNANVIRYWNRYQGKIRGQQDRRFLQDVLSLSARKPSNTLRETTPTNLSWSSSAYTPHSILFFLSFFKLDSRDDGNEIQDYLKKKTGARSVPRTFISGEFVGGNDDLQSKSTSEVAAMIAKRS